MKNISFTKYLVVVAESMTLVSKKNDPGAGLPAFQFYLLQYPFTVCIHVKNQKTKPGQNYYPS